MRIVVIRENYLTISSTGNVHLWDVLEQQSKPKVSFQPIHLKQSLAWSNYDPKVFFTASQVQEGSIYQWDTGMKNYASEIKTHNKINAIKTDPHNSNYLAISNQNGSVQLWDIRKKDQSVSSVLHMNPALFLDFHPKHRDIILSGGQIICWNIQTKKEIFKIAGSGIVSKARWHPERESLFS